MTQFTASFSTSTGGYDLFSTPSGSVFNVSVDISKRFEDLPKRVQERLRDAVVLAQDHVIDAVKSYLEQNGYPRVEVKRGTKRGIDIDATGPNGRLIAEAIGAYATQQADTNHFNSVIGQVIQRMSSPEPRYALALPDTKTYRNFVRRLPAFARQRLSLNVLFVSHDGDAYKVIEIGPMDLV